MNRWSEEEFAKEVASGRIRLARSNSPLSKPTLGTATNHPPAGIVLPEPQTGLNGGGKKRKYGNEPVEIDGIRFDSKKEAARWQDLLLLEKAGEVQKLERQVKFELGINGVVICHYISDFAYIENDQQVIEDVKSTATKTRVYQIKKKLMRALYRIEIRET